MTITTKLSKAWDSELKELGLVKSSKVIGIDYRTIRTAIKNRKCSRKTFDAVNDYLLSKREETKTTIKKVQSLEQDQD